MKTRLLIVAAALAACLSGCGGPRETAQSRGTDQGREVVWDQSRSETGHPRPTEADHSTGAGTGPALKRSQADEGPVPSQEGSQVAGGQPQGQPGDRDGEGEQVELVISGITDASEVRQPTEAGRTEAEGSRRGFCTVAIRAAGHLDGQHALLYCYFTPDTPEQLKKLTPSLLESSFESTKLGTFSGARGGVSGMRKLTKAVPDEVVLCLPQGSSVTGDVGVRAQLWRLSDGRWKPRDEVLEQTITLK